jgi:hypothetical protein
MRALDLAVVLLAAAALLGPPAAADDQPSDPEAGGTAEDGTPGTEELGTEAGTAGGSGAGTGEEPPGREGLFDTLHGVVDSGLRATATWIDAFFSNERYEAELNKTRLRLRFDAFAQEGDGVEFEVEPRLRIVLPGTGRRLSLVAQDTSNREEDADDATGDEVASDREESVEDDSSVALQLFFESTEKRSLRGQLGVRLSDDTPAGFVGARYRELIDLGSWDLRFRQRLRWYTDTDFRSDSAVDFERSLFQGLFFRTTAGGTWFEEETGYFYNLDFRLFQPLDPKGALEYQWINDFQTSPRNRLEQTKLRVRYRRRVWWDWLVLEIAPEAAFPRGRDFDFTPGILLRGEVIFGG